MTWLMKNTVFMDATFKLLMKVNTAARWGFQHSEWTLGIRNATNGCRSTSPTA